jgi:hypothetical protein
MPAGKIGWIDDERTFQYLKLSKELARRKVMLCGIRMLSTLHQPNREAVGRRFSHPLLFDPWEQIPRVPGLSKP